MIVIGVTGGIGTGKSYVSGYLQEWGAALINADKVGHEALKKGTKVHADIVAAWGPSLLTPEGEIDRKKLGSIVFGNPQALARLNGIIHPQMAQMMAQEIDRLRQQGVETVVLEAAILIEANWQGLVDEVWMTIAPEEAVIKRLAGRDGFAAEQVRARIRSQMPAEERAKHATVIINTDCEIPATKAEVRKLWERLKGHGPARN